MSLGLKPLDVVWTDLYSFEERELMLESWEMTPVKVDGSILFRDTVGENPVNRIKALVRLTLDISNPGIQRSLKHTHRVAHP